MKTAVLAGWLVSSVAFFLLGRVNLLTRGWVCKRICISAYLLLVIVLAIVILRRKDRINGHNLLLIPYSADRNRRRQKASRTSSTGFLPYATPISYRRRILNVCWPLSPSSFR